MSISFTCPHCGTHSDVGARFAGHTGPCKQCGQTVTIPAAGHVPAAGPAKRSSSAWPVILIVGVVVLCVAGVPLAMLVTALALPAAQSAREAARGVTCKDNLKRIVLAMHEYEADNGTLPPAYLAGDDGKPKHSWRVLLLPYLGHQDLYDAYNFEEPWDSPGNLQVARQMPLVYLCPNHSNARQNQETSYFVAVGPTTAFPGGKGVTLSQISDGTSRTIVVIESHGQGITWTEPKDLDFDTTDFNIDTGDLDGTHRGGIHVGYADGQVQHVDKINDDTAIRGLLTRDGGEDTMAW